MADINLPNKTQIQPPTGNVASLVSPDTLANLKSSQQPKSFGDQLLVAGLAAGANAALNSTLGKLYKEKTKTLSRFTWSKSKSSGHTRTGNLWKYDLSPIKRKT